MRVLVTGSRLWTETKPMMDRLEKLPRESTVLHGDARGADRLADGIARHFGLTVERYPADWEAHGRAAGPIRNRAMLDTDPDLVLAFPVVVDGEGIPTSPGTRDCVLEAKKRGIPVEVITP